MPKCTLAIVTTVAALGLLTWLGGSRIAIAQHDDDDDDGTQETARHPVAGLWFGTVFIGDPEDPLSKVDFTATLHRDGTSLLDSTIETGEHPFGPGDGTPLHGIWRRHGGRIQFRGVAFGEGANPPETFFVLLNSSEFVFKDRNTLVGTSGNLAVTCPDGPEGCNNPTEMEFPEPGPDVVIMTRLTFD